MVVVHRRSWGLVGLLACNPPGPAVPAPQDTVETADPVDTEVDLPSDPEQPAVSPEVVAAIPAGLLATVQAAALVGPSQLYDLVWLTRAIDHPECTVKVEDEAGFLIVSDCRDGTGEVVIGQIDGFAGRIDAPSGPELAWAQEVWGRVVGRLQLQPAAAPLVAGQPADSTLQPAVDTVAAADTDSSGTAASVPAAAGAAAEKPAGSVPTVV